MEKFFDKFHDQWLGSPMGSLPSPFGRRSLRNKQQMYGNMEEIPVTNSALFGLVGFHKMTLVSLRG